MTGRTTEASPIRLAVFEALKVAAPGKFDDGMRRSFFEDASNVELAKLEMDSLADMEFCISIELSTGVTLLPAQLSALVCTDAIEEWIRGKLAAAGGSE